jgi:hypothetical protein
MHNSGFICIVDSIAIAGFAIFTCVPFSSTRSRDPWAKRLFFAIGLIGILCYSLFLSLDAGWLVLTALTDSRFRHVLGFMNGWLAGSAMSLWFSGQVAGRKTLEQMSRHPEPLQ